MTLFTLGVVYTLLLALLAVISAMEAAIFSVREVRHAALAAQREGVRREIQSIAANPFPHLHRALTLSAMLNLALATLVLFTTLGPLQERTGWNPWLSTSVIFAITVLAANVAPKFLALRAPSAVLITGSRMLRPARAVLDPLTSLIERLTDALLRVLVPKRVKTRQPITPEELETLIEMREEQGALDPAEAAIIREILDVTELTVRDCMIPRVNLPLLDITDVDKAASVLERAESRFVVVHGDTPDAVHGIIDSTAWRIAGRPAIMRSIRPPVYVPETLSALDALERHLGDASRCVLVVDEYGGLEGLVSQEEIVDWLLYDAAPWQGETPEIRELGDNRYLLDGLTRLDHIEEELGVEIAAEGIDTIGGFVFNQLGHVPKPGERISVTGAELKVRRVSRIRVQQVELRLQPKSEQRDEEDAS
jgi:CBS domain containing-hemolysin-like protein